MSHQPFLSRRHCTVWSVRLCRCERGFVGCFMKVPLAFTPNDLGNSQKKLQTLFFTNSRVRLSVDSRCTLFNAAHTSYLLPPDSWCHFPFIDGRKKVQAVKYGCFPTVFTGRRGFSQHSVYFHSRSLTKLDGGGMGLATETEYMALLYVAWRSQISSFSQFCR